MAKEKEALQVERDSLKKNEEALLKRVSDAEQEKTKCQEQAAGGVGKLAELKNKVRGSEWYQQQGAVVWPGATPMGMVGWRL